MRLPDPSQVLDKNLAPMGPETISSTGAGVWRKAPVAFPDSSSVRDKFQSAIFFCGEKQQQNIRPKNSAQHFVSQNATPDPSSINQNPLGTKAPLRFLGQQYANYKDCKDK